MIEDVDIYNSMRIYGGSFVRALAEAYRCADHVNKALLEKAFPQLFNKYRELAKEGEP